MTAITPAVSVSAPSLLDSPAGWGATSFTPPMSPEQVAVYQKEINSIIGLTRDQKEIAKLVWNGDPKYWRTVCIEWDKDGKPIEFIKRPIVLYRSIYNEHRKLIRDIPVPRWLILTRIEPEQYVGTWERDSKIWLAERQQHVQVKPSTPPDEWYVWWMTIADHRNKCCQKADERGIACYGFYTEPGRGVQEVRTVRAGMDRAQMAPATPFDSPDRLAMKLRENEVNDYGTQAIKTFDHSMSNFIDSVPYPELRRTLNEGRKREIDSMLQESKGVN